MAIPVGLPPRSGPISARSSPSPAPAVPATTFEINWSRNGRRSVPPNAIVVSLANPIRSAQGSPARPAASVLSSATGNFRQIQIVDMAEQPLDLCDNGADAIEFTLQMLVSCI